ncbi:MAG: 50S ribosomal protein L29 [Phycisphaeraceae bacterium]|nr:50S ribosomal protein L29 [Phycisphaeraceae bacterium]MCW5754332.1 50S ribosomal protein L29 [Phycisphaeraceae bacterium]
MKPSEVRNMKNEQLALELRSLREKLFRLRQQAVTEKVGDVSQFRHVRRDIARLLTEQRARVMAAQGRSN